MHIRQQILVSTWTVGSAHSLSKQHIFFLYLNILQVSHAYIRLTRLFILGKINSKKNEIIEIK